MIDTTCQYYDGDEDCHKCVKNGFIFSCPANCPERFDDEQEDEMKRPAAEVEPVRRGQWIEHDDDETIHCSACGWESHRYEYDVYGMPRCPNCGARMEPVEDEN